MQIIKSILLNIISDIKKEYEHANFCFPFFNSSHEAYCVILEEVDEYWDEVKKNGSVERKYDELIQIAAMAIKAIVSMDIENRKDIEDHKSD